MCENGPPRKGVYFEDAQFADSACLASQPSNNRPQLCAVRNEVVHAARAWSPEYLPMCSPFIFCALIGPFSIHVLDDQERKADVQVDLGSETIRLVLRHFARYWLIGKVLIGKYS